MFALVWAPAAMLWACARPVAEPRAHSCVCRCSGFLAVAPRVRARSLVVALRVCACPFAAARARTCLLTATSRLRAWSASHPGSQRLGLSGRGSLSLASGSDASGTLSQGRCSAHDRQRSSSFMRVHARRFDFPSFCVHGHACEHETVKVSGAPGRTGESVNADTSPDFSRSSASKLGGFKRSGWRLVAHNSEAAPSPGGFSRARVSNGD